MACSGLSKRAESTTSAQCTRSELRARRVVGVVEVAPARFLLLVDPLILRVLERRPVVIEEPREARGRREAIIEDGVFIAGEQSGVRPLLPDAVATSSVAELAFLVEGAQKAREEDRAGEPVEAMPVRGNDDLHASFVAQAWSNRTWAV
jgi:hypothetical protein